MEIARACKRGIRPDDWGCPVERAIPEILKDWDLHSILHPKALLGAPGDTVIAPQLITKEGATGADKPKPSHPAPKSQAKKHRTNASQKLQDQKTKNAELLAQLADYQKNGPGRSKRGNGPRGVVKGKKAKRGY